MEASWVDSTEKTACLCCGQKVLKPRPFAAATAEVQLALLEALGYTRESLLTKHRAQLDYQLPGMAEWLAGN